LREDEGARALQMKASLAGNFIADGGALRCIADGGLFGLRWPSLTYDLIADGGALREDEGARALQMEASLTYDLIADGGALREDEIVRALQM
jgi:hypothetical protein